MGLSLIDNVRPRYEGLKLSQMLISEDWQKGLSRHATDIRLEQERVDIQIPVRRLETTKSSDMQTEEAPTAEPYQPLGQVALQPSRTTFLRSGTGLLNRQSASLSKRYIPKGGFIKVFEEVTNDVPKKKRTVKHPAMAKIKTLNNTPRSTGVLPSKYSKGQHQSAGALCKSSRDCLVQDSESTPECLLASAEIPGTATRSYKESSGPRKSKGTTREDPPDAAKGRSPVSQSIKAHRPGSSQASGNDFSMLSKDQINKIRDLADESGSLKGEEVEDAGSETGLSIAQKLQKDRIQRLDDQGAGYKAWKARLEKAAVDFDNERLAFKMQKEESLKRHQEEVKRLRHDQKAVAAQKRAALSLPTRKDRSEIEALETILQKERADTKARNSRQRLTVERLRQQIVELQAKASELQEELSWHQEKDADMQNSGWRHMRSSAVPNSAKQNNRIPTIPLSTPTLQHLGRGQSKENSPMSNVQQKDAVSAAKKAFLLVEDLKCGRFTEFVLEDDETVIIDDSSDWQDPDDSNADQLPLESSDREATLCSSLTPPLEEPEPAMDRPERGAETKPGSDNANRLARSDVDSAKVAIPRSDNASVELSTPRAPTETAMATVCEGDTRSHLSSGSQMLLPSANMSVGIGSSHGTQPEGQASVLHALRSEPKDIQVGDDSAKVQKCDQDDLGKRAELAVAIPIQIAANPDMGCLHLTNHSGIRTPEGQAKDAVNGQTLSPERKDPSDRKNESVDNDAPRKDGMQCGVQEERLLNNGNIIRKFAHCTEMSYSNGTVKRSFSNGCIAIHFANGDIKQSWPDGKTEYFYARNGSWQVSTGQEDLFYFQNGQKELHNGDGTREVVYPDGTCFKIMMGSEDIIALQSLSKAIAQHMPTICVG